MSDAQPTRPDKREAREETRRFLKKMLLGGILCLVLFGFVVWICLFRDVPLEISPETTYITEPLTSDGKMVDYLRAIELKRYPPNMKTDENGFRMIVRELGVSKETASTSYAVAQTYEKLGLNPNVPPTMTFEDPHDFITRYVNSLSQETLESTEPEPIETEDMGGLPDMGSGMGMFIPDFTKQIESKEKIHRPWTAEELPMMAEWFKANEPALDLIVEAARQPNFVIPWTQENENALLAAILQEETQRLRPFARALSARANYHIGNGNLDGAIDDIIACKAMGRHSGHHGSMVEYLIGIRLEEIATKTGIAGSLKHQPTKAQLQRLLDIYTQPSLSKLPPREDPKIPMLYDRYMILDAAQKFRTMSAAERREASETLGLIPAFHLFSYFGINWDACMTSINHTFDHPETIGIFAGPPSPSLLLPSYRSEFLGKLFAYSFCSVIDVFCKVINRIQDREQLQAITLAMLIYEKEHGHLPPAWTVNAKGKRLHSWRVLLLPYLGEEARALHEKIRLDEPWDSEYNRQFQDVDNTPYQSPYEDANSGETHYTVMVGPKTAFRGEQGVKLDDLGTNHRNLALVLECKSAINWMDPTSDPDATTETCAVLKEISYGYLFGFRDGSVRQISIYNFSKTASDPDNITIQELVEGTLERIPD